MKQIQDELKRVLALNDTLKGSLYFSNLHKDDREWHIIGSAEDGYRRANRPFPAYAIKRQSPDFELYHDSGAFSHHVEVTMVTPPGAKIHLFHREWEKGGLKPQEHIYPAYTEHWDWLRSAIEAKLRKPYIKECSILVYFDVSLFDTRERHPDDFLRSIALEFRRHTSSDLGIPSLMGSSVGSIVVLSCDFHHVAQLYPQFDEII